MCVRFRVWELPPARIRKDMFVLSPNLSGREDLQLPGSEREGGIRFWGQDCGGAGAIGSLPRASLRALLRVCVWNGIRWHISSHPVCRTLSPKRDLLAPEHLEAGAL